MAIVTGMSTKLEPVIKASVVGVQPAATGAGAAGEGDADGDGLGDVDAAGAAGTGDEYATGSWTEIAVMVTPAALARSFRPRMYSDPSMFDGIDNWSALSCFFKLGNFFCSLLRATRAA